MIITIDRETLTDGSEVFNVLLNDGCNTIAFHALTEAHALTLADQLGVLIVVHTADDLDQQAHLAV